MGYKRSRQCQDVWHDSLLNNSNLIWKIKCRTCGNLTELICIVVNPRSPWLWSPSYILKDLGGKACWRLKGMSFPGIPDVFWEHSPPFSPARSGSLFPLQRRKRRGPKGDLSSGLGSPSMAACLVPRPQHMGRNKSSRDSRHLLVQTRMLTMWMGFWNMREFPWERHSFPRPRLKTRASRELDYSSLFLFLMNTLIKLYFFKKEEDRKLILY